MIIKVADNVAINPDHVVSVTRDYYDKYLIVKTVLGDVHSVSPRYGESIFDAETRVIAMLSAETGGAKCA